MNENVKNLLENQTWFVATCDEEPNVVPIGFKTVLEDGRLAMGDVFMNMTCKNVIKNGKIAISVCDFVTAESYQIKGTAIYVTEGKEVDLFQTMAEATFKGNANVKGAILINPEKVIISTPGPDNNKLI